MTQKISQLVTNILYIKLTIYFLIGRKRTVNFRNHAYRAYIELWAFGEHERSIRVATLTSYQVHP